MKTITNQVGEQVSQANLKAPSETELSAPAEDLIVQLDGGHIPTKDKDQRSFEALSGVIYRPSCIEEIGMVQTRVTLSVNYQILEPLPNKLL